MDLTELFCEIDDFCQKWFPNDKEIKRLPIPGESEEEKRHRHRAYRLSLSEIMTILIHFHQSKYRTFKDYYIKYVLHALHEEFPQAVSYNRFVELEKLALIPMCTYLKLKMGTCRGLAFIDSTSLAVCLNARANRHKVFDGMAAWGKNSVGWYFGFKLHLIINECGELLAVTVTPANTDDRVPVESLSKGLFGKMFGDKGYISQALFERLFEQGIELFTRLRKNMKNKLIGLFDRLVLRKRVLVETVNDQLKNISQIEHTRHRCTENFMVNLLGGLIAYSIQPKKPTLSIEFNQEMGLPVVL